MQNRQEVLAGLLVAIGVLTLFLLSAVLKTVFFAITVAYVLYPLRQFLIRRGVGPRIAAGISTVVAFLTAAVLFVPLFWAVYERRGDLLGILQSIPASTEVEVLGTTVGIDGDTAISELQNWIGDAALATAQATPSVAFQAFLFALLVYGLLLRPDAAPTVVFRTVPDEYHDVVLRLHERVRQTLSALYVLQVLTALVTFAIAYVVFAALGYPTPFSLAALSGILQFIPILGPSIIILLMAATDVLAGDITRAATIVAVGLVFVGFLPDAVIRSQLARYTTRMPATLYFVGFTGGVLSVGLIGLIAGPLVVALFVETVDLLAEGRAPPQQTLQESIPSSEEQTDPSADSGDGG